MKQFRIPLAGPYNTRISAVNSSDSASGYVGVGIVGLMIVGKTTQASDKDARYVNCFAHKVPDPITAKSRIFTVKRPGFGTQSTPASGQKGYAIHVWAGNSNAIISAFGTTNSTLYNGTSSLGAITGRANGISETTINGTPTITVASSDSTGWYADSGSMTKIADGDFPGVTETLTGNFAHMDGFSFVMTTRGRIWASDLNSIAAWTANNFGAANAYPDQGVALIRRGTYVMAFCSTHLEFWINAGLTPFPLARVNTMTVKVGAVSADAIARIADTIFWAGSAPEGGLSVFQYDGALGRISTPEIDAALILAGASNISLTTIRFYGLSFVLCRAGPLTYVYCIEEKLWHEWSSTTPLWYKCAAVPSGGTMVNYAVSNVSTSGNVYLMNHASLIFTDDTLAYTARIQVPVMDMGTNKKKFWNSLELIGDTEISASAITLSYSDDDFQTYTTVGNGDLSSGRVRFTRLGSSRRRGWVWTHSAATPMRLEAMEGNVTIGTS